MIPYPSLRQGLVGAWCPSLGATGLTLLDRSGFGNHAALVSMSGQDNWRASQGSMALNLDGVNDFVSATPAGNQLVRSMSIWVRPNATVNASSSFAGLFQVRFGASISFILGLGAGTILLTNEYIVLTNTVNNYRVGVTDGGSLAADAWHHIAVIESGGVHAVFVNGVSRTASVYLIDGNPGTPTFNGLRIGCFDGDGGAARSFFSGQIDDARIYNRILTPGEIRLLASRRGVGLTPIAPRLPPLTQLYPIATPPNRIFANQSGVWTPGSVRANESGSWRNGDVKVNDGGVWE